MSLLGPASRRPALRIVYRMRPDLYDPTDDVGHPLLVVSVDVVTRTARVVTRTSSYEARGPRAVSHPADPALGLDRPGWWRVFKSHRVPWLNFDHPDVLILGPLGDPTWTRLLAEMYGNGGSK